MNKRLIKKLTIFTIAFTFVICLIGTAVNSCYAQSLKKHKGLKWKIEDRN